MSWTENAFNQMTEGFFTVDIKKGADGVYNFGFIDETRFSTQITYMPVIDWNQWIVQVSGFTAGTRGYLEAPRKSP